MLIFHIFWLLFLLIVLLFLTGALGPFIWIGVLAAFVKIYMTRREHA